MSNIKTQNSKLKTITKPISVRLENISKVYGFEETEVRALSYVNLIVEQGEYCAIMGASGSGKFTAMSIIGCLDRPTTGHYYLDNLDVAQLGDVEDRTTSAVCKFLL